MSNNVFEDIRQWAYDRNLVHGSTQQAQVAKLAEEFGELAGAIIRQDYSKTTDSIGDMVVVLTIIAEQEGINIESCIIDAYHEIKDRKGKMVDGIFVKEE